MPAAPLRLTRSGDSAAPDPLDSHCPSAGVGSPEPGLRGSGPLHAGVPALGRAGPSVGAGAGGEPRAARPRQRPGCSLPPAPPPQSPPNPGRPGSRSGPGPNPPPPPPPPAPQPRLAPRLRPFAGLLRRRGRPAGGGRAQARPQPLRRRSGARGAAAAALPGPGAAWWLLGARGAGGLRAAATSRCASSAYGCISGFRRQPVTVAVFVRLGNNGKC